MTKNHYETLGVNRNATATEIKRKYRKLALEFHPDHHSNNRKLEERFKEISKAYAVLSNAKERALYNRIILDGIMSEGHKKSDLKTERLKNEIEYLKIIALEDDCGGFVGRKSLDKIIELEKKYGFNVKKIKKEILSNWIRNLRKLASNEIFKWALEDKIIELEKNMSLMLKKNEIQFNKKP